MNNGFLRPFLCYDKVTMTNWVIYKKHRFISYRFWVWKAEDQWPRHLARTSYCAILWRKPGRWGSEVPLPNPRTICSSSVGVLLEGSPNGTAWLVQTTGILPPGVAGSWALVFSLQFFHYSQGQVYIGDYPPFKDRVTWAGDLDKKDASINIENIQSVHNGTYICDVKNPPDIVVRPGHIRLHVVEIGTSHSGWHDGMWSLLSRVAGE